MHSRDGSTRPRLSRYAGSFGLRSPRQADAVIFKLTHYRVAVIFSQTFQLSLSGHGGPAAVWVLVVKSATAACRLISYCTLMFLLLEKLLPVLSQALTTIKCAPLAMGTSVVICVVFGEWNTSLLST